MRIQEVRKLKVKGFTLTEMLTVMLIIGILLSLAIPSKQKMITKAKAVEAKVALRNLYTSQTTYFYEFSNYASNISELDFTPVKTINEGGTAVYELSIISSSGNEFIGQARALKDFDGDGNYDTWQVNQSGKITNVSPD